MRFVKYLDCYIIAALCAGFSMMTTVSACSTIRSGYSALALGVIWEIAKSLFCIRGLRLLDVDTRRTFRGVFTLCACAVLMMGSVVGSVAYLTGEQTSKVVAREDATRDISDLTRSVASLEMEIAALGASAAADLAGDYKRRGMAAIDRTTELRSHRDIVARDLTTARLQLRNIPDDPLMPIATMLGLSATICSWLRLWAAFVAAIMIEVISFVALLQCSPATKLQPATIIGDTVTSLKNNDFFVANVESEEPATKCHLTLVADNVVEIVAANVADNVAALDAPATIEATIPATFEATKIVAVPVERMATVSDIRDKIAAVKQALHDGEVTPTVRGLGALNIGQRHATRVLDALVDTGTLVKKGRRFIVAKEAVNG